MIFVGVVGWLVRRLVHSVGLSGVDRALGGGVGLARGGFVACMLVLLMGFTGSRVNPVGAVAGRAGIAAGRAMAAWLVAAVGRGAG